MRLLYACHRVHWLFCPDARDCRDINERFCITGYDERWFSDTERKRKAVLGILDELDDHNRVRRKSCCLEFLPRVAPHSHAPWCKRLP